jgi:hypothetical protein
MAKKKTKIVNETHPMLGYRVKRVVRDDVIALLKSVVDLYNESETEVGKSHKPTQLFTDALRIGLNELKRKRS